MEKIKKNFEKYDIIGVGIFISIVAFGILFGVRFYAPILLDIDAKWLLIGSAPVIISLVLAGIVKGFKGGGLELEFVSSGITSFEGILFNIEPQPVFVTEKSEMHVLFNIPEGILNLTTVLRFKKQDNNPYYDPIAIETYLERLRNVKYLLVTDNNGKFLFVVDYLECLKNGFYRNIPDIMARYLNERDYPLNRVPYRTSDYVLTSASIIDVYDKISGLASLFVPVVNSSKEFIGVIEKDRLYKTIADRAMNEIKKAKK